VEERFAKAKAAFDDENYLEAIEDFKAITVQSKGVNSAMMHNSIWQNAGSTVKNSFLLLQNMTILSV
jgi:hypothetical protein